MNKGLVGDLIGLVRCILLDIADIHPNLRVGFERDILRLETLSANHGTDVFTLFLPALGKAFDASLESGVLAFGGIPLSRTVNRRSAIPRLFQGMWRLFFAESGCLNDNVSGDTVRMMRTLLFAFKKYRLQCAPETVYATVKEYYDVDQALPPASHEWDGSGDDLSVVRSRSLSDRLAHSTGLFRQEFPEGDDAWMLRDTQRIGDLVSSLLGEYLPQDSRFRHGPGAVSDLQTGRGYKYSFPAWGPRLQHVFPNSEFAFANLRVSGITGGYDVSDIPLVEGASHLYAVPKTQKGPRLIAAEPTCNQWCQQSVRSYLSDAIARTSLRHSIDFRRQDLSGELALSASVLKDLATVDLSAASDRLSCWLVERLFRANHSLLAAFIASRTRYLTNDIDKKSPKLYKLRKFASMGSALTFPVQSICFFILCVSAGFITDREVAGNTATSTFSEKLDFYARQVRVYGDDLIVPVSWMPVLQRLFELLYLKINSSKTFVKGNFRESCGTDAFKGVNVSPGQVLEVYDKSNLGTLQGLVDSSNNLFEKGFIRTAVQLLSPVPSGERKLIPWVSSESKSFGLKTGSGFQTSARKRWNTDLHRWEYQTWRFLPKRSRTARHESLANLLQYFTEDPTTTELALWESGVFAKPLTVISKGWEALPL